MSLWTEWCYWHRDSILKQTLMLMDKSGLRKGKAPKKNSNKGKFKSRKAVPMTKEQERENAIQAALNYGIGYNQYKKEVDAIRASRIRERLEKYGVENKEE